MFRIPFPLRADSYKQSHATMYNPNMVRAYYYAEARAPMKFDSDKITNIDSWRAMSSTFIRPLFSTVVAFGLQAYIDDYLMSQWKDSPWLTDIGKAKELCRKHRVPFDESAWQAIVDESMTELPLAINAIPEGTLVPVGTPMMSIVNTTDNSKWLPSWLETSLLRGVWYPTTVATISWQVRQVCNYFLNKTTSPEKAAIALRFMLHDFGARGVSSGESAVLGGMGHMTQFDGSDTLEALYGVSRSYNADLDDTAFSVPAAEHSVVMSWGKDREVECYRHIMNAYRDSSVVSIVSDTWDLWNALENIWGGALLEEVKKSRTKIVIRLDSGDPLTTVLRALDILGAKFGYTVNAQGYKELPDNLGILQGDGVNLFSIFNILDAMRVRGWSASNIVFGMGGALLQRCDRDTFHWAMKMSAKANWNDSGKWIGVRKEVKTDAGKQSKAGRFIVRPDFTIVSMDDDYIEESTGDNILRPVWANGTWIDKEKFATIRKRARAGV